MRKGNVGKTFLGHIFLGTPTDQKVSKHVWMGDCWMNLCIKRHGHSSTILQVVQANWCKDKNIYIHVCVDIFRYDCMKICMLKVFTK